MAQSVTIVKVSDLQKAYKRSSTKLYRTYAKRVPEYGWMDDIPDEDIVPSGRENLIPLDVRRGYGSHQADDGGYEGRTETPGLEEGSFVFNHTNARFSITLRAQAFDKAARGNFIIRQIKYQSIKCIEGVMRKYAYMFYGFSTGFLAQCNGSQGSASSHTITLKNPFGLSTLTTAATAAAYMVAMFPVGEGVALVRSGALVTNAIGVISAYSASAGTISVTWGGAVSITDGDAIVYANGVTGATISETDYNKWNVGLLDGLITDSVHGVATSSVDTWAPALYDTNGGSLGFVKIKRLRQALQNNGETTLRRIIYANGVENDFQARERQALMWTDSGAMNADGNVTIKGTSLDTSRFTPPSCAFALGAEAIKKKVITDKPGEEQQIDFASLYKAEDRSALKGGVDIISANIIPSRSRMGGFAGLNEQ
jgi:hypothetical protein